jgi:hypothetical protein
MPNPVDPSTGRPRRGRPPVRGTSHVIHSDGTYSNPHNMVEEPAPKPVIEPEPAKIPIRERFRHYDTLIIEHQGVTRREVVRDFDEFGVYTKPSTMKLNPSLHECNFWRWDEIEAGLKDVKKRY